MDNNKIPCKSWENLIRFCQEHEYCEMKLMIRAGKPHLAETIKTSYKFDLDDAK